MRYRIDVQQLAAYITIVSMGVALADQLRRHAHELKALRDGRKRKREGFGFAVKK